MKDHASEILPGLWQGSVYSLAWAKDRFQLAVLCAREIQPEDGDEFPFAPCEVARAPIEDSDALSALDWGRVTRAAAQAATVIKKGGRVLVTCAAGLNRSGLVSALTVRHLTGMSGDEAVRVVQNARSHALHNPYFVRLLEKLPARHPVASVERRLAYEAQRRWR
jgi:hypothetical protein